MKLQPKIMVKQRELSPVKTKGKYYYNNGALGRLLKNIKRSHLTERVLICAAVSPKNDEGVFLDDKGHEYLIKSTDLNSDLTYISSKFVKKKDKKFVGVRYPSEKYNSIVKNFLKRPDVQKKYKDWIKADGLAPSVQINEETEEMDYEVGKCYIADDGEWSFKVLSNKDGEVKIKDLTDGRKYTVEVSDLELMHPDELDEAEEEKDLSTIKSELESKYKELEKVLNKWRDARSYAQKYLVKYGNALGMSKNKDSKEIDPNKIKGYKAVKDSADKYMAEHSRLTQEFKKLYRDYRNAGGDYNKDWYIASTEWDDED